MAVRAILQRSSPQSTRARMVEDSQAAPHNVGSARAAADLEGGVERKGREDTRVSRHCLRAPLGLPVGGANSVPLQMFLFPRETSQRICVPQQLDK